MILPPPDHFPEWSSQLPLVAVGHLVNGVLQGVEPCHDADILARVVGMRIHSLTHVVLVVVVESKDPLPVLQATLLACTTPN